MEWKLVEARSQQAGASRASRTKKNGEEKCPQGLHKCANVWCTCTSHAHNGPGVFFERGYLS